MSTYGEGSFNAHSVPAPLSDELSVVFFGSGPVAAESLRLLTKWLKVDAVVTKPQPAHHKEPFPVLVTAQQLGLKIYTPNGKKELSELITQRPFTTKLGVVIDYGFIINQDVIDSFPLGIVNSHFSLLPQLRGADPISFAILNGSHETGVSLMLIVAKMDEGPLLAQTPFVIPDDATTVSLTEALIDVSDKTLQSILPLYYGGSITPAEQDLMTLANDPTPSYSRKLTKDDGILDWAKSAHTLEREIRAYSEWPKSRATLAGKEVVITKAHVLADDSAESSKHLEPGSAFINNKTLNVVTADGVLVLDSLKPIGKNEMPATAFLAGYGKNL